MPVNRSASTMTPPTRPTGFSCTSLTTTSTNALRSRTARADLGATPRGARSTAAASFIAPSGVLNARIQPRVRQIDGEIGQDDDRCEKQIDAGDHRIVAEC